MFDEELGSEDVEDGQDDDGDEEEDSDGEGYDSEGERLAALKAAKKAKFDSEYDRGRKKGSLSDESEEEGEEGGEGEEGAEDNNPLVQGGKKHLNKTVFALSATKRKDPSL